MMLRLAIAEERGFKNDLNTTVLAKIMLAERFAPEFYDAIARGSASSGKSEELASLEAIVRDDVSVASVDKSTNKGEKNVPDSGTEEPTLPDWPGLEWAKQWARIDPPLGEYDLRPYVFVTRDHRSVFGAVTSLGQLDELAAKLMGPPLQIRQAAGEVRHLTTAEAEQLFDAIRSKVTVVEDLSEQPSGIPGLAEICQHHAFLQAPLVALLKNLPSSKLGPWAAVGWQSALTTGEAKRNFDSLLKEWSEQDENKPLKAAAQAVPQLGRSKRRG